MKLSTCVCEMLWKPRKDHVICAGGIVHATDRGNMKVDTTCVTQVVQFIFLKSGLEVFHYAINGHVIIHPSVHIMQ